MIGEEKDRQMIENRDNSPAGAAGDEINRHMFCAHICPCLIGLGQKKAGL